MVVISSMLESIVLNITLNAINTSTSCKMFSLDSVNLECIEKHVILVLEEVHSFVGNVSMLKCHLYENHNNDTE